MPNQPRNLPLIQPGAATAGPPIFDRIAIIGLGLVGGSIALAARERWPTGLVIAVDRNEVLEKAMVRHAIDVAADDLVVAAEAALVILAAPVRENIKVLTELEANIHGPAIITDVSSTKRAIVEAAARLPLRLTFVGGHPLGGAARGGIDFARPDLFAGRPWIFTPTSDATGPALERLFAFVAALGARPQIMAPAAHDRLVAFLSHLPQLTASGLMHIIGEAVGEEGLSLAGRGLVDTTRLASSPASVWRDVCDTNADEIGRALDALIAVLTELRRDLHSDETIDRIFESASAWHERLLQRGPS